MPPRRSKRRGTYTIGRFDWSYPHGRIFFLQQDMFGQLLPMNEGRGELVSSSYRWASRQAAQQFLNRHREARTPGFSFGEAWTVISLNAIRAPIA